MKLFEFEGVILAQFWRGEWKRAKGEIGKEKWGEWKEKWREGVAGLEHMTPEVGVMSANR